MWVTRAYLRGPPAHGPMQEALPKQPRSDRHPNGVACRVPMLYLKNRQPPCNRSALHCQAFSSLALIAHSYCRAFYHLLKLSSPEYLPVRYRDSCAGRAVSAREAHSVSYACCSGRHAEFSQVTSYLQQKD